jgi:hypothetical protein
MPREKGTAKTKYLNLRVSPELMEAVEQCAKLDGYSTASEWVREVSRRATRLRLEKF